MTIRIGPIRIEIVRRRTPLSWRRVACIVCVFLALELSAVAVWAQLPAPTPVTIGAGTQIALKLIDQLPAILQALGILAATGLGMYNARKITQVQSQTNGHFSELSKKNDQLITRNDELHTLQTSLVASLAASVPAAALAPVVDRVADRADRAAPGATVLVPDRRADAPPIKVDIVSTPETKATEVANGHKTKDKDKETPPV